MSSSNVDYPFIRVRRKLSNALKVDNPPVAPVFSSKPPNAVSRPVRKRSRLPRLDTPVLRGSAELSESNPVYRLDALQSGIGSLIIKNAEAVAWEMHNLLTGLSLNTGKASPLEPPSINSRPILGWSAEGDLSINLRHGAKVRRLIVASYNQGLFIKFYDGSVVYCPMNDGGNAVSITRIGYEFEIRLETVSSVDLLGEFGMIASNIMTNDF